MTREVFKLRPYQKDIIKRIMSQKRTFIMAGMGLGKTVSTLTALKNLYDLGELTQPTLVLAPLRVARSTWPSEAKKWKHLEGLVVQPIVGKENQRRAALLNVDAQIFTANYETIVWLLNYLGENWFFEAVVADESTKLKNFRLKQGTKRAQALSKVAHTKVDRWINLSGTPAANGIADLWGQMWFIDKGARLGRTYATFESRWFYQAPYSKFVKKVKDGAAEEVQELIKDVCLSIKAEDHFDLKEPIRSVVEVEMAPSAKQLYKQMEKNMYVELESGGSIEVFNPAALTIKCHQIANGAMYYPVGQNVTWEGVHSEKLMALESIVEEACGQPVLVAYKFASDRERIIKYFDKFEIRTLDGDPKTIDDWNAGKIPILLAHPASAGHGLNLQDGGNILVFYSVDWNLEEHEQITERLGATRQAQAGRDRPVFIYYILTKGTVDYAIMDRLKTKKTVQEALIDALRDNTQS